MNFKVEHNSLKLEVGVRLYNHLCNYVLIYMCIYVYVANVKTFYARHHTLVFNAVSVASHVAHLPRHGLLCDRPSSQQCRRAGYP